MHSYLALAKSYIPQALTRFHNHTMCGTNTPSIAVEHKAVVAQAKASQRGQGNRLYVPWRNGFQDLMVESISLITSPFRILASLIEDASSMRLDSDMSPLFRQLDSASRER